MQVQAEKNVAWVVLSFADFYTVGYAIGYSQNIGKEGGVFFGGIHGAASVAPTCTTKEVGCDERTGTSRKIPRSVHLHIPRF